MDTTTKVFTEEDRVLIDALEVLGPKACISLFSRSCNSAIAAIRDSEQSMSKAKVNATTRELAELSVMLNAMVMLYDRRGFDKYKGVAVDRLRQKIRAKIEFDPALKIYEKCFDKKPNV